MNLCTYIVEESTAVLLYKQTQDGAFSIEDK